MSGSLAIRCLALGLVLLRAVILPGVARAQEAFHVIPSLKVAQVYDSNLLAGPSDRQGDFISRVSPGLESGYRSIPWTLLGRYSVDAERFADHPQLATLQARQHAAVDFRYHPTRRLVLAADTAWSKTQTPGELNAETGLTVTRARARRLEVHPSVRYQFDPATTGTMEYTFTEDRVAGGIQLSAHSATVSADRHVSRRDTASVGYGFREFLFGSDDATTSHVFTIGWTRGLTRLASLTVRGGPRVSEGATAPELSASLRYHLKPGELSLAYSRAQTTLIGLAGTADTHSIVAAGTYNPRPSLQMRIAPGFRQTARAGLEARVYRLAFEAAHQFAHGLSLEAAYDVNVQHGNLYAARTQERITRHVLLVRLAAAPRPRLN